MGKTEIPKSTWRERKQDIKKKWHKPVIYLEWLCERLSYRLGRWAFLDILGHIGRLAILVAVISYIWGIDARRKERHNQAWQVINAAQGKSGSGGRIEALQDLNREGVHLAGINISNAWLRGIELEKAVLIYANLSKAVLWFANLRCVDLSYANLSGAELGNANLYWTRLDHANLSGAVLWQADLSGAYLYYADLSGAYLRGANLSEVFIYNANLSGAELRYANLSGAMMYKPNLDEIKGWQKIRNISDAQIYDVNNPPDGFIEWAQERGAKIIESEDEWIAMVKEKEAKKK